MVDADEEFHASTSTSNVRRLILWSHQKAATRGLIDKVSAWTSLLDEERTDKNENWTPDFCFLSKDYFFDEIQQHMKKKGLWTATARPREVSNDLNLVALQAILSSLPEKYGNGKMETILVMARNGTDSFHEILANLTSEPRSRPHASDRPFVAMLESPGSWITDRSLYQTLKESKTGWRLKNRTEVESHYRRSRPISRFSLHSSLQSRL